MVVSQFFVKDSTSARTFCLIGKNAMGVASIKNIISHALFEINYVCQSCFSEQNVYIIIYF